LILPADFTDLTRDGVRLCGDVHYVRDGGTENRGGGVFTGGDGHGGVRGDVLEKVGVEWEAVSCLQKRVLSEKEGGRTGGWRRLGKGVPISGDVGSGDGGSQGLIAWRNEFDFKEGPEWGGGVWRGVP